MSWDPIKLKASVDELKEFLPEELAQLIAGLKEAAESLLGATKITITFEKK